MSQSNETKTSTTNLNERNIEVRVSVAEVRLEALEMKFRDMTDTLKDLSAKLDTVNRNVINLTARAAVLHGAFGLVIGICATIISTVIVSKLL